MLILLFCIVNDTSHDYDYAHDIRLMCVLVKSETGNWGVADRDRLLQSLYDFLENLEGEEHPPSRLVE